MLKPEVNLIDLMYIFQEIPENNLPEQKIWGMLTQEEQSSIIYSYYANFTVLNASRDKNKLMRIKR